MADDRRPIGYWLKHLDRLIEENFARTLAGEGLTRRHWQVLNTLQTAPSSRDAIAEALAPFLAGDPGAAGPVVDDLVGRGWVAADPNDELALTEAGTRARAALLERVAGTRRLLVQGISDEEYLATVDVLRRKAENLERAAR